MNIHKNAVLTSKSRGDMALRIAWEQSKAAVKWFDRFHTGGEATPSDRSSRPLKLWVPVPGTLIEQAIELRSRAECVEVESLRLSYDFIY